MFDLIDEASSDLSRYGYAIKKLGKYDIEIGHLSVDKGSSKQLGFDEGEYVIVNSPLTYLLDEQCHKTLANILKEQTKKILKGFKLSKNSTYLIVGVGNPDIWADSLGKRVVDKIELRAFDKDNKIFKICPNIYLNTGISTFKTVSILTKALKIDCVILIDSLATNNISRLGISFQINSVGLTPGSALKQNNSRIDSSTLGVNCLSFGVPFMLFAKAFDSNADEDLILAPKDIHEQVEISSGIIASALNGILGGDR